MHDADDSQPTRRDFLRAAAASAVALSSDLRAGTGRAMHVAVVGAGAFGGWTALHLLRRGARVTLLDAWGPGNSRASSGGETRVIRATYGPDGIYVKLAARALTLWRENEARWKRSLFHRTGVLWLAGPDDRYERAALPLLREQKLEFDELSPQEAARRWPQINFAGVSWAIFERDAGYLAARFACQAVVEGFRTEGGDYRELSVVPGGMPAGELAVLNLSDGSQLAADQYVFACGPWLGKVFPDVLGKFIQSSRQEVYFFGTPPGDARFREDAMPAWIDNGVRIFYGIPGNQGRGFKIADDSHGAAFDPTSGDRTPSAKGIAAARSYLRARFPALGDPPLLEARVCQYENSRDGHFILDRHPHARNVWLLGGGSGHGFKHGPSLGELAAATVLGEVQPEPFFLLSRFSAKSAADAGFVNQKKQFEA
ncbi:MAG: FAD-dependent oxidoreductase [Acidobacteria bacterium]|nr:FAD-dependent oxidoreductase [Acidobacteriota bacterium]